VTHGPAEPHSGAGGDGHDHDHGHAAHPAPAAHDDQAHGHGHGPWHGPHESPRVMTVPLMVLAIGAIAAGFVGVPEALLGNNAIEHFLHPSFTAHAPAAAGEHGAAAPPAAAEPAAAAGEHATPPPAGEHGAEATTQSYVVLFGLMLFSVVVAAAAMAFAYHVYVRRPAIAAGMAARFAGVHKLLLNKYYVDELYDATAVRGTMAGAAGSWAFDRRVVDGAVNGTGWTTIASSWAAGLFDKYVVDGLVNLIGWICAESSYLFRRVQTGLIQNYAMAMLFGVFAFLSLYLFVR
jgi:NADH-quinone oxidoreductase subunit L